MNPLQILFKQLGHLKETVGAFMRRWRLKKIKTIYFHNDTDFEFIESTIDRLGRYAEPSQISEKHKIKNYCRCLNNNKKYLFIHKRIPYTFDTKDIHSSSDDSNILSAMAWDIYHSTMYDVAVTPTEKMDLIYIGLIGLLLGVLVGTYFF